ncbi:bacterio-opsin activator [Natronococcus pandeyae]|uniref:Bacterio-opsin activator n=1 Tax=Natronococcus pandeyae TaxID=2055836 RepID=A0A8J8Q254_9EURY|nr:helix-turn-helix domain-containing protein [Natronococcus pandeyae]TYL38750.1 bacterio-opsin activator [Natronococcus pandeyae]
MLQEGVANDERIGGHFQAIFTIEPHPEADCTLLASGSRGEDVSQNIVCQGDDCDGCECRSTVQLEGDAGVRFVGGPVHDRCICPVFRSHEYVASIERVEHGSLEVELTVLDRATLETIVDGLRATGATVRLRRITAPCGESEESWIEIEASGITAKQREAVLIAVEEGYYETPRRADLEDLADALDVSKSAVSQRLSAVESNLITSLFERESGMAFAR